MLSYLFHRIFLFVEELQGVIDQLPLGYKVGGFIQVFLGNTCLLNLVEEVFFDVGQRLLRDDYASIFLIDLDVKLAEVYASWYLHFIG